MANFYDFVDGVNSFHQLPKGLLMLIAYQENGRTWQFKNSRSPSGASGLMQLMPITLKQIYQISGLKLNPLDMGHSVYGAGIYLKWLYSLFGNWRHAIAAYNYGLGGVRKNIAKYGRLNEAALPNETRNYMYVADTLGL